METVYTVSESVGSVEVCVNLNLIFSVMWLKYMTTPLLSTSQQMQV